jgi:Na+-transporting NADH:ubiquinone oxidoreductase subunit D
MAKSRVAKVFTDGLGKNNPVFVQILGICSTLAVTNNMINTLVMCAGLIFTLSLSNFTISLMRKLIPSRIRMMVETLVIAAYVIIVDIILRAYLPDISKVLGPYVGLIITNCIVMGRAEAYALQNPPGLSLLDGIASGIGYSYVLIALAFFREIMGAGTLFNIPIPVFSDIWTNWNIMIMAPGAFFTLAIFVWVIKSLIAKRESKNTAGAN